MTTYLFAIALTFACGESPAHDAACGLAEAARCTDGTCNCHDGYFAFQRGATKLCGKCYQKSACPTPNTSCQRNGGSAYPNCDCLPGEPGE